jgi:alanine racemase
MSWTTRVNQIKEYPVGARLGYNGTFVTPRPSRIGILPVGYADGYPRACSNRARVLIREAAVPVVGLVSMDYTMVDLTERPAAKVGDTVTLIGRDGEARVTAEELAAWSDTIPYCITTALGSFRPRMA